MNKASGSDGIPAELFQALKDDAVKVLYSICQQILKTRQSPQDWKRSVFIPMSKDAQTILQFLSFHILVRLCSESFKPGFNSTWTMNLQMFKLLLEKAEEPEIKLPTSIGSLKKQQSSRKTYTSALLTMPNPLTVWITTNCGKFFKRWEYQTIWPVSCEICMQVRSNSKNWTWKNRLVPNWERSMSRLYVVTLLI